MNPRKEMMNEKGDDFHDGVIKIYWKALKQFSEDQIYAAYDSCINELKFFPKPAEVVKRIPDIELSKPEKFRLYEGRCQCGHTGLVIQEPISTPPRCKECYTGLASQEVKKRLRDLSEMMNNKEYRPEWDKKLRGENVSSNDLRVRRKDGL